jgi:hypothetical protein
MISKYCAKIINVWNFSDPIVEVMLSEFSGTSLPSSIFEKLAINV